LLVLKNQGLIVDGSDEIRRIGAAVACERPVISCGSKHDPDRADTGAGIIIVSGGIVCLVDHQPVAGLEIDFCPPGSFAG